MTATRLCRFCALRDQEPITGSESTTEACEDCGHINALLGRSPRPTALYDVPEVTFGYSKAESGSRIPGRYYIAINGTRIGWVNNFGDADGWSFYAPVREVFRGQCLARGFRTRRDAIAEGLSQLDIHHYGRLFRPNPDTYRDETFTVNLLVLRAACRRLHNEKYLGDSKAVRV